MCLRRKARKLAAFALALLLLLALSQATVAYARDTPPATEATLTPPPPDPPRISGQAALRKAYTEHLGQLLTAPGRGGVNELGGALRMRGTDLGAPFELNGQLAFLFGDSWVLEGQPGENADSLARTSARFVDRFRMPRLTFAKLVPSGAFAPFRVPGITLGGMEVPVEGLTSGNRAYVFFVSGWDGSSYRWSVLADGPASALRATGLRLVHRVESDKFLNISAVEYRGFFYLYGAGDPYRHSRVFLARVPVTQLAARGRWRYFQGTRAGSPVFGPRESSAAPITPDRCVGELSVRRHPATGLYLMVYNCGEPFRGYHMRTARTPWGPWSRREVIFDASERDGGYRVSQHFALGRYLPESDSWEVPDDGLAEPDSLGAPQDIPDPAPTGRGVFGGEYGPYLVPRWFRTRRSSFEIVYLHSTWNPYKVHLMRTVLVRPGASVSRPVHGEGLPRPTIVNGDFREGLAGWQVIPGTRFYVVDPPGRPRKYVSTYNFDGADPAARDNAQGAIYQDFTPNKDTRELVFRVHGGHASRADFQRRNVASVRLYHGNEIVRETFGLDRNDRDVNAAWNIEEFRGEPLRLVIADNATGPWGFITAGGFELRE